MPDTPCPSCGAPFGFPDLCVGCRGAVRFFGRAFPSVATSLACEPCAAPLHELRLGTVRVDVCLGCHGLWLDRGELHELLARPPTRLKAESVRPAAEATQGFRDCPHCRRRLDRVLSSGATLLRCRDHGVWLPAATLLTLLRAGAGAAGASIAPALITTTPERASDQGTTAGDVGAAIVDGANLLEGVGVVVDAVGAILSAIDLPG